MFEWLRMLLCQVTTGVILKLKSDRGYFLKNANNQKIDDDKYFAILIQ